MKITLLELYHVAMELKGDFETSFGKTRTRHGILVRLVDNEGYEGWGEIVSGDGPWYSYETIGTAWHIVRDYLVKFLGGEISPVEFQKRSARIRGHNMAKAGIDEALWDLYARRMGKPLYEVIGGEPRPVKVGVSIGIKRSIDELLQTIAKRLEEGYERIKLKIKPGTDIQIVEAVRREYPDLLLQVDANAAYSLQDLETFRALDKYDLLMMEQPLHYDDLLDHSMLKTRIKTPLCLDESIKSPRHARYALQLESADIINIKPGRVGGITPSLQIHDLWSQKAGRPVWIGGMLETGVGRAILVALGTLSGVRYHSDISASDRYYEEDIITEPWTLHKGSVLIPRDKPGIGVKVDMDKLEKYTLRKEIIDIENP
ncbi:MAG: o-succinylbenzoate synthase [Desulfurococcales archaeon]|nr:o-succinylbenzoate synthase [Desulfurococcales archaeon]